MQALEGESLSAILRRFLRFGFLAWGGPVAQIAMIKRELVEEERWIEPSRFNRLLAIYQVLPSSSSLPSHGSTSASILASRKSPPSLSASRSESSH